MWGGTGETSGRGWIGGRERWRGLEPRPGLTYVPGDWGGERGGGELSGRVQLPRSGVSSGFFARFVQGGGKPSVFAMGGFIARGIIRIAYNLCATENLYGSQKEMA